MKKTLLACVLFLGTGLCVVSSSYCQAPDIEALVDDFEAGTDLQRDQIRKDTLSREISASGIVSNAQEYDFFDTVNDIQGTYYQVSAQQRKTKNNTPYQLIFLFRSKDEVKDLNKGDNISKKGKVIRIDDERLQIAVWIFCAELSDKDKDLFSKNPSGY